MENWGALNSIKIIHRKARLVQTEEERTGGIARRTLFTCHGTEIAACIAQEHKSTIISDEH